MQPTPSCLSLLFSLVFVSLTGSAPLDGQVDDTDYLKWPEIDSDTVDLMDFSATPLPLPSLSVAQQGSALWEEEVLQNARHELQARLNRQLATSALRPSSQAVAKRYRPTGYMASRGKRFLPGLESLLLANYYKDTKWKRQPHYGFHGSRG